MRMLRHLPLHENDYYYTEVFPMFKSFTITVLAAVLPFSVMADDSYTITIKDHIFSPETLEIPADKRVKLTIDNQDATPEEFESHDMDREKIIGANSTGIVYVGPL